MTEFSKIDTFQLPSDPSKDIHLRLATVRECESFSGFDAGIEEQVATRMLNELQYEPAKFVDPREMTADDRRFAALWYFVASNTDQSIHIPYPCNICGEEHDALVDYSDILAGYQPIEGKAEREIEHDGTRFTVRPIDGWLISELEELRLGRSNFKPGTASYNSQTAVIRRHELVGVLTPVDFKGSRDERVEYVQERVLNMPHTRFSELYDKVMGALDAMKHGLDTVMRDGQMEFLTQPMPCEKEAGQSVRVRFSVGLGELLPRLVTGQLANAD